MKILKFRAWEKDEKRWLDKDELFFSILKNEIHGWQKEGNWQISQYTGLKDKNGKEIYEGDIVAQNEEVMSDNGKDLPNYINKRIDLNFKYGDGSIGERRWGKKIEVVEWKESSCGFEPFSDSLSNCGHCGGGISPNQVEIVGNIYENPELLKNEHKTN